MADVATLGITVNAQGAIQQVKQLDTSLENLAQSSNKVSNVTVAGTRNMGAWAAMQAEASSHVGQHSLAVGRLEMSLARVVERMTGVNSAVGMMASGMLKFGLGSIETVAILAGIAAITAAWQYFTGEARKAKEENDKLRQSLEQNNFMAKLGPEPDLVLQTNAQRNELMQQQSRRRLLLNFGVSPTDDRIVALNIQIAHSQSVLEEGEKRLFDARMKGSQLTTVTIESNKKKNDAEGAALDKEIAALKLKATLEDLSGIAKVQTIERDRTHADQLLAAAQQGTQAYQDQVDAIAVENKLLADGIYWYDARYEAAKKNLEVTIAEGRETERINKATQDAATQAKEAATKAAEEAARPFKNMMHQLQTEFATFFDNIFTKGIKSFGDLVSSIKAMFLKMIAELMAADLMKKLAPILGAMMGMPAVAGAQGTGAAGSGGMLSGLGMQMAGQAAMGGLAGAAVGYGVGQMTGNATGGAITGAASGAAVGFLLGGPIGALAGGLTGLVGGLLGGASAARAAAAAMRQLQTDYTAAIAAFKHDDLAAALAQNQVQAEALMKAIEDMAQAPLDVIMSGQFKALDKYKKMIEDVLTQEGGNAETIRRQAVYAQEDLAVRNLRATGQGDAANLLAFQEKQQREMQAARDGLKDQLYLDTLATVQNSEMLAYLNGTLQDATRNSPTGFYGSAFYAGAYATPRGYPTDGGGGGVSGGTDNAHPPLNRGGNTTIQLVVDGKVLTAVVVGGIDRFASSTGGSGSSRSDALNRYVS
jgi:hypothetical protein